MFGSLPPIGSLPPNRASARSSFTRSAPGSSPTRGAAITDAGTADLSGNMGRLGAQGESSIQGYRPGAGMPIGKGNTTSQQFPPSRAGSSIMSRGLTGIKMGVSSVAGALGESVKKMGGTGSSTMGRGPMMGGGFGNFGGGGGDFGKIL